MGARCTTTIEARVASVAPFEPETIREVLDAQAGALGDMTYFSCDGLEISYAGIRERSLRVAGGLHALGLRPGDRVAVLSENSVPFAETFFACAALGLVIVPLNIFLRGEFLRYQLDDSGCAAAIVDQPGLAAIQGLDQRPSDLQHLIVVGDARDDTALPYERLAGADPCEALPTLSSSDMAAIVYTSGTTGMPKGCMIPHGAFTRVHPAHQDAGYITPGDRVITPSPMFHMGFLQGMLTTSLRSGASTHVMRQFSATTFMQTARDIGATVIYAVGSVGMLLLAQPPSSADRDPSRLRAALLPPMPPDRQVEFEERFGVPVVAESYGQTECVVISCAHVDAPRCRGSAGPPAPTVELEIVDDRDRPLPPGEVGEIVIRPRKSDSMFLGYSGDPVKTLETWRNLWHHTGDLGRLTPDGNLWIVDRKKDSIRRRGENVSSIELEAALSRHPAVRQVAVHAVPSELGDDEIKACIVVAADAEELEPAALFDFCKRTLPYFAVPRYVELMAQLPVNAVGRVRKQELRDRGITSATWDFEALGLTVGRDERRGAPAASTAPQ
jgi:crotonobetaine/carnitine-CoA ligase